MPLWQLPMTDGLQCDNDIVLKICCCDLAVEALSCLRRIGTVWILGTARYVVASRISRSNRISDKGTVQANFEFFIEAAEVIEPTESEVTLAAEFEAEAQKRNLALDNGESILVAAFLERGADLLLTGDKRAVAAIEGLRGANASAAKIGQRVACLEQLFLSLLKFGKFEDLQLRVCREPATDVALSNCFSCSSGSFSEQTICDGLESYVFNLRAAAPNTLLPTSDLSIVPP